MQKLIFLFFILFISLLLEAQNSEKGRIKGHIENENKSNVSFVSILLKKDKDSSLYKTAISDEGGDFSFNSVSEGKYFIEVTMIGFEKFVKVNVVIDADSAVKDLGIIVIKKDPKLLGEVTVKTQPTFLERQIDKTVVNVENSIIGVGLNVLEMLQKLPGVQVSQDGQIALNGKSAVNIFIDGRSTYLSADELANLLRGMSSSNIQKIEIMAKPSAKYEAAGSGGIINIIKKRNHREGLNGSINGGVGQGYYRKYNGGFNMNYKAKWYNLVLNMAYINHKTLLGTKITNDILNDDQSLKTEQVANNRNIGNMQAFTPTIGIEFYPSKRTTISLSGTAGIQSLSTRIISDMTEMDSNKIRTSALDFMNNIKDKPLNYSTNLHLVHVIDTTGAEISVDLDYSNYVNKTTQDIGKTFYNAEGSLMSSSNVWLDQARRLHIYAGKADYSQPLKNHIRLEFGWKSSYVRADNDNKYYDMINGRKILDSSQTDYTINEENINAGYINFNKELKKLSIQAGLRAEQTWNKGQQLLNEQLIKQNYFQLFPSVFMDYKMNEQNGLNIKISRRIDRPAYFQMNPFRRPLSPTLYFRGNPNLKPQLSFNTEVTYSYQNSLFITTGVDFFQNYIGTLPFLDTNKISVTRIPTNIKGSKSYNLTITYSKRIVPWWTVNYNLSAYKQAFNGEVRHFDLQNSGIVSYEVYLNNNFTINDKLSAEFNLNLVSKHRVIATIYNGYHVLSVGIKQSLLQGKGTLAFNMINILQSENESSSYQYRNLNQYWDVNFYTRYLNISFTYRFGKGKAAKIRTDLGSLEEQKRTKM